MKCIIVGIQDFAGARSRTITVVNKDREQGSRGKGRGGPLAHRGNEASENS